MSLNNLYADKSSSGIRTLILSFLVEKLGAWLLKNPEFGSVTVKFPNGKQRTLGNVQDAFHSNISLLNFKVLSSAINRGTLGFAASYINKDIEIDNLTNLFRFFLKNQRMFKEANRGIFKRAATDLAYHLARNNTREGSKQNISEHYDLGNDFYALWLDPSMTYSSAYFAGRDISLQDAQHDKYRRLAHMADIQPHDTVLEIGCGWGGFAETVSRELNAHVRGITLSKEQLKYGQRRLADAGLSSHADLVFEDYRDTSGQYDHVISIEMIEAVGEDHWPEYFQTVSDRLKPHGTAAIQAITILDEAFERYKSGPDFIQRYIFPGGMLMTDAAMHEQASRVGLTIEQKDSFGKDYAKTLRIWRTNFIAAWPEIQKLGFDEEFKRKWIYYLCYCEAGFEEGLIDVAIYQYRKII